MLKKNLESKTLVRQFLILMILLSIASCTQQEQQRKSFLQGDSIKLPVEILAGKPFIVNTDTCPPPFIVALRKKTAY